MVLGPGRAGPGIDKTTRRKYRGSLRPRSHRSQGPIGPRVPSVPPKGSMDTPQGSLGTHTWISKYGYPYMGSLGSLGRIHGSLGGSDGTLGAMGPGPQGPPILPPSCFIDTRPVPARPAQPGPAIFSIFSAGLAGRTGFYGTKMGNAVKA